MTFFPAAIEHEVPYRKTWQHRARKWNEIAFNKLDYTGRAKKVTPYEKIYISGIVTDFFTKFIAFTDEYSGQISCKFC